MGVRLTLNLLKILLSKQVPGNAINLLETRLLLEGLSFPKSMAETHLEGIIQLLTSGQEQSPKIFLIGVCLLGQPIPNQVG